MFAFVCVLERDGKDDQSFKNKIFGFFYIHKLVVYSISFFSLFHSWECFWLHLDVISTHIYAGADDRWKGLLTKAFFFLLLHKVKNTIWKYLNSFKCNKLGPTFIFFQFHS